MAVTPFKTFSAGEILTASDLNSSFAQVFDNGEDLGWPASQAKDFNGVELILDADGDTSITSDTDDQIDFKFAGTDRVVLKAGATDSILDIVATATTTGRAIDVGDANALTTGSIFNFVSNSADTSTRRLGFIHNNNSAAVNATVLTLQQDATERVLFLAQNADGVTLEIDTESTTANPVIINADPTTTGKVIDVSADGLTTGSIFNFVSNSADTGTRNLGFLHNDNAAAVNATVLTLQQDAAERVLFLAQNADGVTLEIDTESTTANPVSINADPTTTGKVIDVSADGLTTGSIFNFVSNSADTGTRNLGFLHNDNTLATGATVLTLQQDAAQRALFIDQNGNDTSVEIDSANTTSDVVSIAADSMTIGRAILVSADGLTAGGMMLLESNSSSSSSRNLAVINNVNASATGANVLYLSQAANAGTLDIDSSSTTTNVATIDADSLTSGAALAISSNSSSASGRDLVSVLNDNTAASGTIGIRLTDDSSGGISLLGNNTNASFASRIADIRTTRTASSSFDFITCLSNSGGDAEFRFRGDGEGLCDGSFTGGGADYAEYFEWVDGNPNDEDRRGISVELVGHKIQPATAPEKVFGVISARPTVVGDSAWNKWYGKYLLDDFGSYILEDYEVWSWEETSEEGRIEGMVFAADEIPEDIKVPENKKVTVQQRRKLNPEFDPDVAYIPRDKRKEWACVGWFGKLRVRKGQMTYPGWSKMRDISNYVEEWATTVTRTNQ
jgi:hypothetical protein